MSKEKKMDDNFVKEIMLRVVVTGVTFLTTAAIKVSQQMHYYANSLV